MTSTVKNIKVGNTSYPVQDTKATPFLSRTDEATLLSDGTYRGETVANGTIFTKPDGTLNNFTKPIIPPTWTSTTWAHTYVVYATHGTVVMTCGASYGDLLITRNGGSTWSTVSIPSGGSGNGTCYHKGRWYNGNRYMLRYSENDGVSWTTLSGLTTNNSGDVTRGSLFSNGSVMISSNTGRPKWFDEANNAWVDGTGTYNDWSYPFAMDTVTNYVYTCSGTAGAVIGKSSDCKVWNAVTVPVGYGRDVAAYNNIVVYAADAGLYCSTNGGSTWTKIDALGTKIRDLYCLNGTFMARSRNATTGDYVSTDGLNWTRVSGTAGETYGMVCYNGYFYTTNKRIPAGQQYDYTVTTLSYTASEVDTALGEKQTAAIVASSDPTASLRKSLGDRYLNSTEGTTFVCTQEYEAPSYVTNYTTYGTVNITDDKVATFNSGAYIRPPQNWTYSGSPWAVEMKFTTPTSYASGNGRCLFRWGNTDCMIFLNSAGYIVACGWSSGSQPKVSVSLNTTYWLKVEYDGSNINLYLSTTSTFPTTPSASSSRPSYWPGNNIVCYLGGKANDETYNGSIDLTTVKWYSNGVLVWEAITLTGGQDAVWTELQNKLTAGTGITIGSGSTVSLTIPYETVETLPVSPTSGKIYFVTGSTT